MSWFEVWKKHVIWAEQRRNDVYPDSKGIPTVGIGHNLISCPKEDIPAVIGFVISDERVDQLFEEDSKSAIHDIRKLFGDIFDSWTDNRKAAIVDLMFNMGFTTFITFTPTIAHIRAGEWEDVAQHLEGSKWYRDVKRRGPKVVKMIREG